MGRGRTRVRACALFMCVFLARVHGRALAGLPALFSRIGSRPIIYMGKSSQFG